MDKSVAIHVLKNYAKYLELLGGRTNSIYASLPRHLETVYIAIEALEKQIPKPVKYLNRHGDGSDLWNKDYFNCPTCGRRLRNKKPDPYCPRCGQALTWR